MTRPQSRRRTAAPFVMGQPDGYLLIVEDKDDASVVGVYWARLGMVHGLMTCLKEDRPNAHLVNFTACTQHAYALTADSILHSRVFGGWHHRAEAVEALLEDIEDHQRIEMDRDLDEMAERQSRRSHRKHAVGYAEAAAAH